MKIKKISSVGLVVTLSLLTSGCVAEKEAKPMLPLPQKKVVAEVPHIIENSNTTHIKKAITILISKVKQLETNYQNVSINSKAYSDALLKKHTEAQFTLNKSLSLRLDGLEANNEKMKGQTSSSHDVVDTDMQTIEVISEYDSVIREFAKEGTLK